jgi:hypothetical protein
LIRAPHERLARFPNVSARGVEESVSKAPNSQYEERQTKNKASDTRDNETIFPLRIPSGNDYGEQTRGQAHHIEDNHEHEVLERWREWNILAQFGDHADLRKSDIRLIKTRYCTYQKTQSNHGDTDYTTFNTDDVTDSFLKVIRV